MKLSTVVIAAAATMAAANPIAPRDSYCPVQACTIDTTGTYYNYAYVRPNACNNNPPLDTLYDGDVVYPLGTGYRSGCGYTYVQVLVSNGYGSSGNIVGWINAQAMNCGNYPPPPPPPAAASSSSQAS